MLNRKETKQKGKIRFSQYFQEFNNGDRVAIVREQSTNPAFPKRIQGLTGVITGKRGSAYLIKINEGNKEKTHIIRPINLKKIK